MNRHAAALGLSDTHYANPIGLDEAGNYSSAADLATLTSRLLRDRAFARIAASKEARLRSLRPPRRITTINELLYLEPWVTGVKTGHTFDAGYVLVGSGERKGVELISVGDRAPTRKRRDGESLELLESGFAQYRKRVPIRAGQDMADPSIRYAGGSLPLRAARSVAAGTCAAASGSASTSSAGRGRGADRARRGRSAGPRSSSTAARRGRRHCARPPIPEANIFDKVRSFVADHTIPTAVALFVILIGAALLGEPSGA